MSTSHITPTPSRSKKRLASCALAFGLLAVGLAPAASASAAGRYVVVLKGDQTSARKVAARHDRREGVQLERVFGTALKGYSARLSGDQVKRLKSDPAVSYMVPDQPVHVAAKTAGAQTLPSGVDRIDADLSAARAGDGAGTVNGVAVAVLDTGSGPHPDLNIAGGKACVGRDYNDGNGHGTHTAGSIAAKDDGAGVVGVAPGAPIYSVRVLDSSGGGSTAGLLCGIDWITANAQALGISVASLSLSTPGTDDRNCGITNQDPIHQAVCASVAKGVTYVAAAGNNATDFAQEVPAAYDEVLTVTAVSDTNGRPGGGGSMPNQCSADPDDSSADFSNFAAPGTADAAHTIAAPGKCINSTWRGGGFRLESGTSMATPHVAGGVTLCIATGSCAGLSPAGVIAKLRADAAAQPAAFGFSGDPRTPISGRYFGNMLYVGGYQVTSAGGPAGGSGNAVDVGAPRPGGSPPTTSPTADAPHGKKTRRGRS